ARPSSERTRPVSESAAAAKRATSAAKTQTAAPRRDSSEAAQTASRSLRRRLAAGSIALLAALGVAVVVSAAQGPAPVSLPSAAGVLLSRVGLPAFAFTETDQRIVEQIRLPRIVTGALVGLALGVAGAVLQGL